jgi:pimeloyl-ACP methyl ester carboxylesterase
MGGYIALTLALHHPRLVRSLVLSGTGPGGGGAVSIPPETQAAWNAAIGLAPQDSARRTMPYSFPPHWTERHPERFEHILARRLRHPTPPACWAAQYAACVEHFHNGLDAERIHASALILHGDGDRVVPVANGCLLAGRMPHAQLRIVPGGGHLLALEDPPAFAAEVRDFIAQVEARAPA